jgi:hypothetical protein
LPSCSPVGFSNGARGIEPIWGVAKRLCVDTAGENRERGNGPVRILMKSGMWLVPEGERPLD